MGLLNAITSIQSFGSLAIFSWMFVEGFYLVLVIHFTFKAEKLTFKLCAVIGWGIPSLLTILRVIIDFIYHRDNSWLLEGCDVYLVTIPILIMLGLNVIFLIAILCALGGKLRNQPQIFNTQNLPTPDPDHIDRRVPDGRGRFSWSRSRGLRKSCPPLLTSSSVSSGSQRQPQDHNGGTGEQNSILSRPRNQRFLESKEPLRTESSMDYTHNPLYRSAPGDDVLPDEKTQRKVTMIPSDSGPLPRLDSLGRLDGGARQGLSKLIGRMSGHEFIKTVKAGLTLMPLLGLPEIIFITPYHASLKAGFDLINAILTSTQGFWVSLLYCFLTSEVRERFRKKIYTRAVRSSIRTPRRWPPIFSQDQPIERRVR